MTEREQMNKLFFEILSNATIGKRVKARDNSKLYFNIVNTFKPSFAWPGKGNIQYWVMSPHVLVGAVHHGPYAGTNGFNGYPPITFWSGGKPYHYREISHINHANGKEFKVKEVGCLSMEEMCKKIGLNITNDARISRLKDVLFIILDKETPVPNECVPYFMPVETIEKKFGSAENLVAWTMLQGTTGDDYSNEAKYATPTILNSISKTSLYARLKSLKILNNTKIDEALISKDIVDYVKNISKLPEWPFAYAYSGDSGKPVFLRYNSDGEVRDVLLFSYHFASSGPSYNFAIDIFQKIAQHFGDELKVIDETSKEDESQSQKIINNLYITSLNLQFVAKMGKNGMIYVGSREGTLFNSPLYTVGKKGEITDGPYKILIDDKGRLFILNKENKKIWASQIIERDGKGPFRITLTNDGSLKVVDSKGDVISNLRV